MVVKTGVDTTPLPRLAPSLLGEDRRLFHCCRASQRLVLTRACANEVTARFIALVLKPDYLKVGWVECR